MSGRFYIFLLVLAGLFPSQHVLGQEKNIVGDGSTVVYKNILYGGLMVHTNGWGIMLNYARNKTVFKARLFELDIVGMKHPKEVKSYNPSYPDTRSYIYGKLNTFNIIRPLYGRRHVLNDKIRKSGVQIGYTWGIGPALGFTKPVYLQIGTPDAHIIVQRYNPNIHGIENIYGRASWFNGLDEIQFHPGVSAKASLFFEFSPQKTGYKAVEVGSMLDAFTEKIPIMYNELNKQFYLTFFIAIEFGKKYNTIK